MMFGADREKRKYHKGLIVFFSLAIMLMSYLDKFSAILESLVLGIAVIILIVGKQKLNELNGKEKSHIW